MLLPESSPAQTCGLDYSHLYWQQKRKDVCHFGSRKLSRRRNGNFHPSLPAKTVLIYSKVNEFFLDDSAEPTQTHAQTTDSESPSQLNHVSLNRTSNYHMDLLISQAQASTSLRADEKVPAYIKVWGILPPSCASKLMVIHSRVTEYSAHPWDPNRVRMTKLDCYIPCL